MRDHRATEVASRYDGGMAARWEVGLYAGVAAVSSALALVWMLLMPGEVPPPRVPYEEFTADLQAGRIMEIEIGDRAYTYLTRDRRKQTLGPSPDIAQVRAMRPRDADMLRPKIYFAP
jgi:hypothetical protein